MLMAGIARQWTDGVDIARVLHSDGHDIAKERIDTFREQSKKETYQLLSILIQMAQTLMNTYLLQMR